MNKKLDGTHRDISKHDIETNLDATKMVIEKYPDGHDDDEKKTPDKKTGEIYRVISEKETEIHQYALDNVTIESLDGKTPSEMEKCVNNEDEDKKQITSENENEGVIYRDITYDENMPS